MIDSLKKRYLVKLLANVIAGIVSVVIVAIVPKNLGPELYGNFTYLQQFFNRVISFLDAGTSTAFFTKLSANNNRQNLIKFYFLFSLLLLFLLLFTVVTVKKLGYLDVFFSGIPIEYVFLGLCFGFLTWLSQIYIKIADAYALTVSIEIIKISQKLLMVGFLICIVNFYYLDLLIYYYFNFIFLVLFMFVAMTFFFTKKIIEIKTFFLNVNIKLTAIEFYRFSSPLFVFNVFAILVGIFDIWLLQKVSGSVEVGFYGLAYSISAMCFLFTSAMTPIITREFSKSFEEGDLEVIKSLFRRYTPMLYSIAAYFGVFVAFEAESLLNIFTGDKFEDAYLSLVILGFYPLHQTYGQINAALFFASEDTVKYRNIGLLAEAFGLILTYILVFEMELGAIGFALKMLATQFFGVNAQLFFNTKKVGLNYSIFLYHQIYAVLILSLIAFVSGLLVDFGADPIWDFLITGVVYTCLVIIGGIIMPSIFGVSRKEIFSFLRTVVKKCKRKSL